MPSLPDPARSYAVLMGASQFEHMDDLPGVRNNVYALHNVLTNPRLGGLDPAKCLPLLDMPDVRTIFPQLRKHAEHAEDTLFVYFAGHGRISPRGHLHLCFGTTDPDQLWSTSLPYEQLRSVLQESPARRRVVILDCCFSGRAIDDMAGSVEAAVEQAGIEGTYVLTATSANELAIAPTGELYTAFTGALLQILHEGIPGGPEYLTYEAIYPHLRNQLVNRNLPRPRQQGSDTSGRLGIARNISFFLDKQVHRMTENEISLDIGHSSRAPQHPRVVRLEEPSRDTVPPTHPPTLPPYIHLASAATSEPPPHSPNPAPVLVGSEPKAGRTGTPPRIPLGVNESRLPGAKKVASNLWVAWVIAGVGMLSWIPFLVMAAKIGSRRLWKSALAHGAIGISSIVLYKKDSWIEIPLLIYCVLVSLHAWYENRLLHGRSVPWPRP